MEHNVVVEWAPFELVEGADEAKLLQASAALQDQNNAGNGVMHFAQMETYE